MLQRADIILRLGRAWPGREQRGLKNLEDALAIYDQLEATTKAADVHALLCHLLYSPTEIIDLPRAERHFRKAEAVYRQMPPNESFATLYCYWCWICIWRMQVPEAFEAASRAVQIADEHGSPSVRAGTSNAMAGEPPHTAVVHRHAAENHGATRADWIARLLGRGQNRLNARERQGPACEESVFESSGVDLRSGRQARTGLTLRLPRAGSVVSRAAT